MNSFRRWDDAEEQVEVLAAANADLETELTDARAEIKQLDDVIRELKTQLFERCAGCPTPVMKTVSGDPYDWRNGGWVKR